MYVPRYLILSRASATRSLSDSVDDEENPRPSSKILPGSSSIKIRVLRFLFIQTGLSGCDSRSRLEDTLGNDDLLSSPTKVNKFRGCATCQCSIVPRRRGS